MLSDFRLPKTVKVAVCICRYGVLALCECEVCDGGLANLEILAVNAAAGLKANPEDAVLLCHRVRDRADINLDRASLDGYYGDMLFVASLNDARLEELHLLAATYDGDLLVLNLLYYISTVLTDIEFYVRHFACLLYCFLFCVYIIHQNYERFGDKVT